MRIFLIGAGAIAREHAKAAMRLGLPVELHVADARPDAAAKLAADYLGAIAHKDVASMLAVPASLDDVVVVATPVFAHHRNVLDAIASGRHVLCEKPLGLNDAEATEMYCAARAAGRRLGCCSSRFLGTSLASTLRKRIAEGALGSIYHVTWRARSRRARSGIEYQPQTTWFVDRKLSGGGILFDWGPYDVALLCELFTPTRVDIRDAWIATPEAFAANHPPVIDVDFHAGANLLLHTAGGGVRVTFERATCAHGPAGATFAVEGTRGAAVYEWLNFGSANRLTFFGEGADGAETQETLEEPMGDVHERPLRGFVDAVIGHSPARGPLVADAQAMMNFRIIRAMYDTAEGGGPQSVGLDDIEGQASR